MLWCELAAPQAVFLDGKVIAGDAATAVSLQPEDFVIAYEPQEASVGLPFLWPRSGIVPPSDEPR